MNKNRLKLEVGIAVVIFIAVLSFIISGFMGLGNCWDRYTTEQQAITNCEGVNK